MLVGMRGTTRKGIRSEQEIACSFEWQHKKDRTNVNNEGAGELTGGWCAAAANLELEPATGGGDLSAGRGESGLEVGEALGCSSDLASPVPLCLHSSSAL